MRIISDIEENQQEVDIAFSLEDIRVVCVAWEAVGLYHGEGETRPRLGTDMALPFNLARTLFDLRQIARGGETYSQIFAVADPGRVRPDAFEPDLPGNRRRHQMIRLLADVQSGDLEVEVSLKVGGIRLLALGLYEASEDLGLTGSEFAPDEDVVAAAMILADDLSAARLVSRRGALAKHVRLYEQLRSRGI